ncbi:MAG TPA: prolyl oligopeptidase family serine peptidase [Pirellulaceae bacterium]
MNRLLAICCLSILFLASPSLAQQPPPKPDTSRGDKMLADYFAAETKKLQDACLADIKTLDDWKSKRGEYRRQLLEMLGLDPLPEKTDLKPTITGKIEHDDFIVEKLHFQSRPGLYVTGNLYLPKKIDPEKPLPTILYVCGHSRVLGKNGKTPMGAKAGYQHHGAWYAKNGYACLTIDTLQLGEIEGIHHGTHRYGMWWWLNRGYTPAGVEAWNCVRALDYLETRPEADRTRFGVTGRSGGGAYSWWIAAIDDRIQVAVPTAGITDLQNHVVDGCVEGHCDCMFMVNTYRWDYPQVAALLAPRPLLISNTDSDGIFPLDGVVRTFDKVRRIYRLFDSEKKGTSNDIALNISPGPHKDTQELNTHEFRWFNHYLKHDDSPIDSRAPKYFEPEQLKVFDKLPDDQINTKIHETFVAKSAVPPVPADKAAWEALRNEWLKSLHQKSFRDSTLAITLHTADPDPFGPRNADEVGSAEGDGIRLSVYDCGWGIQPRLFIVHRIGLKKADLKVLTVVDQPGWEELLETLRAGFDSDLLNEPPGPSNAEAWGATRRMLEKNAWVMMYVAPRGIGVTAWDQSERKQVQNRRRFYLLGQTLDRESVWDVTSAIGCATSIPNWKDAPLWLQSRQSMAGITLYAALFEPNIKIARLDLHDLPKTHRDGPYFLNVERFLDMPQALAMAAQRSKIVLYQDDDTGWEYPQSVAKALNWPPNQIQIRRKPTKE